MKHLNGSIKKAFDLLECFTAAKPEWGVTELSKKVGANKSTTYRMLATLESLGALRKDLQNEKYSLGLKLFELGNRVYIKDAFVQKAHPELEKVAENIAESVQLGIQRSGRVIIIDKIESPKGLRINSQIGSLSPVHCTSLGKVLLAFSEKVKCENMMAKCAFEKRTELTIRNKKQLQTEILRIRKNGFAIDKEEHEMGLICVGVPVFNKHGILVAAMSASGPATRFREEALPEYVAILKKGAAAIKDKIGFFEIKG